MAITRRAFIGSIGAGIVGVALPSYSVPAAALRRLGIFYFSDDKPQPGYFPGSLETLKELAKLGWAEPGNLSVVSRYASAPENIASRADELVRSGVDVIYTEGTSQTRGVQRATKTIPIVTGVGDPVGSGFAASLARPGGNITGLSFGMAEIAGKQVELLRALVPGLSQLVVLIDGENPGSPEIARPILRAAEKAGIASELVLVRSLNDVRGAFRGARGSGVRAIYSYSVDFIEPADLAALAIRNATPVMFNDPANIEAGGLMSFNLVHERRAQRSATQLDKVLRGANPAEIPFELPTKSEFVINRKTARALKLAVPADVLVRADRVIDS